MHSFLGKVKNVSATIQRSWWKWFLYGFLAVAFLYATYFIFIFNPTPTKGPVNDAYWSGRQIAFRIYIGAIALSLIVYGIVAWCRQKLTAHKVAALIFCLASLLYISYSFATPIWDFGFVWNQHDIYYGSTGSSVALTDGTMDAGGGHFGLTMTFYRYFKIPQIRWLESKQEYDFSFGGLLQRYHPKTQYMLMGLYMRINSIFIHCPEGNIEMAYVMSNQEWALLESVRILLVAAQMAQLYFVYRILQRLRIRSLPRLVTYALFAFCPIWCFFANWIGNDAFCCVFGIISIYYAIVYFQNGKTYAALLCALSIGVSLSCKLSSAPLAFVIAPMLIYRFVQRIKESKGMSVPWYRTPAAIMAYQMIGFAIIAFPIGLFWPMYNLVKFGQPLTFFSQTGNPRLDITRNIYWSLLVFPNDENFTSIWVYHYINDTMVQDYSLWTNVFKKGIFNEYRFLGSMNMCAALYASAFLVYFVGVGLMIYRLITMKKEYWKRNLPRLYITLTLLVFNAVWTIYYVARTPQTCNCDIRYFPTFVLGMALAFGIGFEATEDKQTRFAGLFKNISMISVGVFAMMALSTYVSLFPVSYGGPYKI